MGRVGRQSYRGATDRSAEIDRVEWKCAGEVIWSKREADLSAGREASLWDVPWEQIRWAKAKSPLTTHCRRLGYLGANSTLPPAFWFAGGRRHHAAVAKRVKATVSAAVTLIQI